MASGASPHTPLGGSEHPQTPSSIYHAYGMIDHNNRNFPDFWKLISILVENKLQAIPFIMQITLSWSISSLHHWSFIRNWKRTSALRKVWDVKPWIEVFLCGQKSVAICGIKSILNFISHGKSVSSTNQADLFYFILCRKNQVKHILL